ncbi:synaptonemal complex protein 1-like [Hibiscus syriacus]|uniref:Synaptonemal complex protein 1-like n=1 Tax=Hibiscus syriacus TaxID=106335 RepID=A0A6A2XZY5_HIBSY|nr:synaptonemal complex protein 1-like [Hibiscus syriacus]
MLNCNLVDTSMEYIVKFSKFEDGTKEDPTLFKSLVGSLRYLTCTRPNILFTVGVVRRYIEAPTSTHLKVGKRILHYLKVVFSETLTIEKTHPDLCSSWEIIASLGVRKNNPL